MCSHLLQPSNHLPVTLGILGNEVSVIENRVVKSQGMLLRAVSSQITPTKSSFNRNMDVNSSSLLIRRQKYILQAAPHLYLSHGNTCCITQVKHLFLMQYMNVIYNEIISMLINHTKECFIYLLIKMQGLN